MLEREKERMSALAQGGKAENVDSTRTFQGDDQGGATQTDVGDGDIPDHGLGAENVTQGDCGRNSEGDAAVGVSSSLEIETTAPGDGELDDKTEDIGDRGDLVTDEVQTHARASGTEVAAVEWDDDEGKID
jgi:hypothetical protein